MEKNPTTKDEGKTGTGNRMERKHYQYVQNRECEYFPCHPGADPENFNCLFCYCPLYMLGASCGGQFRITDKGIKDCTPCLVPHLAENFGSIVRRYGDICRQMNLTAGGDGTSLGEEKRIENECRLWKQLRDYAASGMLPMHMPGHKRRLLPAPGLPFQWDMTEVEGVDDLHDAQGILRDAMARTARFFGAERSWYLVGGSTVGNLAMISAAVPCGAEVICARNSHRSVLHACALRGLTVHWITPDTDPVFGVCRSVRPEQVERLLQKFPHSRAVILTSPTYEGIVSDIRSIADLCHRHCPAEGADGKGIPLLVDEAHGAHFGLFPAAGFPDSAIHLGADMAVQSAHKTLPSLTQTAFLHWNSGRIPAETVEEQLDIYETSSPSYPLMASLDGCTGRLEAEGEEWFLQWRDNLCRLYQELSGCRLLRAADFSGNPAVYAADRSKILVNGRRAGLSGAKLSQILRERFQIETEMSAGWNVLAMTSCADRSKDLDRFADAVRCIDRELCRQQKIPGAAPNHKDNPLFSAAAVWKSDDAPACREEAVNPAAPFAGPETTSGILRASEAPAEPVDFLHAAGRTAAESVFAYPPGIPLIVPGEVLTRETAEKLEDLYRSGAALRFSRRGERPEGCIMVLCG